jgi:hypothetical protein
MNKMLVSGALASALAVSGCGMMSGIGDKLGFGDSKRVSTSTSPDRSGVGTPPLTGTAGLTVGELLKRGAKQLTSSQITQLASGSTFEGMGAANRWRAQQAGDGTLRGTSIEKDGRQSQFSGRWWVDNAERLCMVNETMGAGPDCTYLFSLEGQIYAASTNAREAPVTTRTVTR